MTASFRIKRGDPFSRQCTRKDPAGNALSLSGTTVISQVRATGFVDDLSITVDDEANGVFTVSIGGNATLLWPIGVVFWDVRFVGSNPGSTRTVTFLVEEDVTRAP